VLLDLAGGRLGQLQEAHLAGTLEAREQALAVRNQLGRQRLPAGLVGGRPIGAQLHKGQGCLAPLGIGPSHHTHRQHGRMLVEGVFHLDGRDVFAARDDDVLGPILELHIAIGIEDPKITTVKPAIGKSLLSGLGILEIALHHGIAPKDHLAHGLAIARHFLQRLGVDDRDLLLDRSGPGGH